MAITIRKALLEDVDKLLELQKICYDHSWSPNMKFKKNFDQIVNEYYSIVQDKQVLGNARNIQFTQNLRGVLKPMGGISMVTNDPEYRRKGHVRALMTKIFQDMYEEGTVFSTLYPFKNSFYVDFGYVSAPPIRWVEFNPNMFRKWKILPAGYSCKRMTPLEGFDNYKKIHDQKMRSIHGGIFRDEKRWTELRRSVSGWLILIFNPQNEVEGYMLYSLVGYGDRLFGETNIGTLQISEIHWLTTNARNSLFHYIYLFSDQLVRVFLPQLSDEFYYYSWVEDFTKTRTKHHLLTMARIIDVEKCLQEIPVNSEGTLLLEVEDPQCAWNNHVYKFVSNNGHLDVKIDDTISSTVKISIKGLTALLYGTLPYQEIKASGWISGASTEEAHILETWFPPKTPYLLEDF